MGRTDSIVVVGGGLAAAKAVEGLRADGYAGGVTLVGSEPHLPYDRPPLSKDVLLGNADLESTFVHPAGWYDDHEIDLRLGSAATALDLDARTVTTAQGQVDYDRLLIATGSTPRRLPVADDSGGPVVYLRTLEDSGRIKAALQPGRRLVIIGGGWIGLEVAAAARVAGCDVVVVEALDKPLVRVLGSEVAAVFAGLHESHGVDLRTNTSVAGVEAADGRVVVHLSDAAALDADLIVVGVGAVPDQALAATAGLEAENGVVVDRHLRTSHPDVFAAGDVANAYHPVLRRHLRVEHWDNAIEQGRVAARNMLGTEEAYVRLPYFFTDQYDLGMEYVGHVGADGYDEVVLRGDVPGRVFTAFWLTGGRVLAGMQVNDWDAMEAVRRIVAAGAVDIRALRDSRVPLDDLSG